jgi:hypothetical protein
LDEITPGASPTPSLPFRRPADYYATSVGDAKPLFPRWVPYGCGIASIVVILVVFIGGYFAVHGGMGRAMDWMFSSMQGEVEKMFTKEVSPVQKANFKAEMKTMRDSVRQNRLPMDRLQPLLRTMQNAIEDEHVTPAEADQLTKEMHAINTGRLKPAAPQKK